MSCILELKGAAFSYGKEGFIEGLNLQVSEADFIGLLGANGSGKSTMLKLMAGILRPHRGDVTLWGKPVGFYRNIDRAKLLSYLPQVLDMNAPFRVREIVGMGLYPYMLKPLLTAEEAMDMVGLSDKKDSLLSNLSGGERRRAFIAMTLLQGAGIILLDEPLANLDIRYQMEIIRLLRRLNAERKISIVMALHDINLASRFDRLILIKDGGVIKAGAPEEVITETHIKEAFDIDVKIREYGKVRSIIYAEEELCI